MEETKRQKNKGDK